MTDDLEQTTITPPPEPSDVAPEPAMPETAESQAPTTQVVAGNGRQRWFIAGGLIVVLAVVSALAVSFFTGRAANAVVLGYVPTDSIMYGEVRMDLPGDQRAAVGGFLSKFPGFADQSAIEGKIDEVFDRIVGAASDGEQAYSADIKPWFSGEVAFSVGPLPAGTDLTAPDPAMRDGRFLVLVSVKDAAAASAWLDGVVAESGATRSSEAYGGTTINGFSSDGGPIVAYAVIDGKVATVGDETSVKAAIDTKGAGAFGSDANLKAALDATSGDHLGFVYVALGSVMDSLSSLAGSEVAGLDSELMRGLVPDWGAFALRVEGDALRLESIAPKTDAMPAAEARASTVANHLPASTIALSVSNDYGAAILKTLELYRSDESLKPAMDSIDEALGVLGGSDAAVGWIGDLGVAVTRTDAGLEGGLVIVPTDRASAENVFTSIRTLASLGGSAVGVTIRDEDYNGTTITIVDLGDVSDLAGLAGVSPEMLGGASLPSTRIELAYAITDEVVVLGANPGFVRSVLDTTTESSLASSDRYKALVGRVGAGSGIGFADLTAIRELVESAMATANAPQQAQYEQEVKPFLEPFDALVGTTSIQGDLGRSTLIVTVK
jgi:hypothetical protein